MGSVGSSIGNIGGSIGNLLGGTPQGAGSNFQGANISNPLQSGQLGSAYTGTTNALAGQEGLANLLAQQGGLSNQQDVYGQQQALAHSLQMQAMGQGPNPAQAQLAQNTGNNIAGQSALMASQRGASANPGLIARQAGMQGGAIQQQSAGQAATLQAQQQLAAQQQLGQQQQAMQQVAGNQVANQIGGVGNFTNAALSNQGQLLGAAGGYNSAQVGSTSSQNAANAGLAQTNANNTSTFLGGGLNSLAKGAMMAGATGGQVSGGKIGNNPMLVPEHLNSLSQIYNFDDGGYVYNNQPIQPIQNVSSTSGGDDKTGSALASFAKQYAGASAAAMSNGGKVQAMLSPGEKYIPPKEAEQVADGKKSVSEVGKKVPGKAEVKGNSLKNDVVPAKLEEGGIVIPRSIMDSKDPVKEGTRFLVDALKKHGKSGAEESDFKSALKNAISSRGA